MCIRDRAIHAASKPVEAMDQEMNRRMMIEDFARKVEMKGMVDVKLGIGTQSITALQGDVYKRQKLEVIVINEQFITMTSNPFLVFVAVSF